jgi:hypothetical protein
VTEGQDAMNDLGKGLSDLNIGITQLSLCYDFSSLAFEMIR